MTAHIVVDDANPGALFCRHCSDLYAPDLPISIERYLNACRGFVLMHKLCPKPEEPSRQLDLPHTREGIDGSTDEPAEEIDPPGPDPFAARYPMATDHGKLRGDLAVVLGNRGLRVPSLDELRQWHERSGVFDALAHWARLEIAHMNAKEHPEIQIPGRIDMPEKLAELLGEKPKKRRTRAPKEAT